MGERAGSESEALEREHSKCGIAMSPSEVLNLSLSATSSDQATDRFGTPCLVVRRTQTSSILGPCICTRVLDWLFQTICSPWLAGDSMKIFGFWIGLLASIVVVAGGAQARGPYGSIGVGNWKGGAYTNDKDGSFSHCAAASPYQSGILFVVSVNRDYGWTLGFAHENWKLIPGQAFEIVLTFDGQQPFNVHGVPLDTHLVSVPMPANSSLIAQFRKAKTMTAFTQGHLFQFSLNQTGQLLPSLVNCVENVKKNGVSNAGEFAVAIPKPAIAKPVVATAQILGSSPETSTKTGTQTGTGFVISNNGHVVTNQHVVDGCVGDIEGNLSGEAPVKLRLVSSDETNDLALLQAPSPFKDVATFRDKAIHPGDSVIAIGYPFHGLLTSDFTVTTGIVSSLSGILNDTVICR